MDDGETAEFLRRTLKDLGADWLEGLFQTRCAVPKEWLKMSPAEGLESLRCRLEFTQNELAEKSGLTQAQVSRIEGGSDALLSTWTKLYAAMGVALVILPLSALSANDLRKQADGARTAWQRRRQRAKPRRRRMKPATLGTTEDVSRGPR